MKNDFTGHRRETGCPIIYPQNNLCWYKTHFKDSEIDLERLSDKPKMTQLLRDRPNISDLNLWIFKELHSDSQSDRLLKKTTNCFFLHKDLELFVQMGDVLHSHPLEG